MANDNFHIDGRIAKSKDIQRSYQFELLVPNIGELTQNDFTFRCRSASIPGRGNEVISSFFLGQERFYPGKPTWGGNNLAVEIEEYDDQRGIQALNSWNQLMFDADMTSDGAGFASQSTRVGLTRDVTLLMYKYNGEKLPKKVVFYNAWLESISDTALNYNASESVKYTATLRWDYFLLKDS
jgi:hypothetical protein